MEILQSIKETRAAKSISNPYDKVLKIISPREAKQKGGFKGIFMGLSGEGKRTDFAGGLEAGRNGNLGI